MTPPPNDNLPAGNEPTPVPANQPPASGAPPPLVAGSPPLLSSDPTPRPSAGRQVIALLLSVCLGLFLADAFISLLDDSLILVFGVHALAGTRAMVCFLAMLMALLIYVLMALIPMIPKRLFLPLTLFNPIAMLGVVPFAIYAYGRLQQVAWVISLGQVIFGLGILCLVHGRLKWQWPLVPETRLGARRFSWGHLSVFLLANIVVLVPAVIVYLVVCTALAVNHFSEGFMTLRPSGFTVQVRKYARKDGKTIQLFPMSHIGESDFYRKVAQTFPTNSIILMEGVSDDMNLLTNHVTYKRMATTLGLAEQHEEFNPTQGEIVPADVDVAQFTTNTIGFLNLVMLIHSKGVNAETVLQLMRFSPPPHSEEELWDDLLHKRNRHLLEELHARLPQTEHIIVPWGVAHMPGIAAEIQKAGFRLDETQEYVVIRFRSAEKEAKRTGKSGDQGKPK